jgi:hypothetical protein
MVPSADPFLGGNPMSETNKVVVRFSDGRVQKGTTEDFFPNRPSFHLRPLGGNEVLDIKCKELKAVFFVRDFAGDPQRRESRGFEQATVDISRGKKIAIRFKDGELVFGYTLTYMPDRSGYFITPADPVSNNLRIYVLAHATREVKLGPAADVVASAEAKKAA